jgi:hypothetical protein
MAALNSSYPLAGESSSRPLHPLSLNIRNNATRKRSFDDIYDDEEGDENIGNGEGRKPERQRGDGGADAGLGESSIAERRMLS